MSIAAMPFYRKSAGGTRNEVHGYFAVAGQAHFDIVAVQMNRHGAVGTPAQLNSLALARADDRNSPGNIRGRAMNLAALDRDVDNLIRSGLTRHHGQCGNSDKKQGGA